MTVATQGYMSPSAYGSTDMFGQSHNIAKSNNFLKTFGNGLTNRIVEDPRTERNTPRSSNMESLNTSTDEFFDFEPPTSTASPYRDQFSTPGASGMSWTGEMNFQTLSPPDSASFSPKDPWAFGLQNPPNLMTNIDPAHTRAQYGQVTPPDDENDNDNENVLDYHIREQQRRMQPIESESPTKKRKRNSSNTNEQFSQPTKRTRKYASRNSNSLDGNDKPEDAKRSKFLERNRVAASKCRQKKKEWTQSLETRARDLQKNNNLLRMNLESLRQEVLFLKGEMLKHSNCDCTQIQEFMKSGGGSDSFLDAQDNEIVFKREHSPIESMPGSAGSSSLRHFDESTSPAPEIADTSIVNDEDALEALLASSINHDTSDEGIDKRIGG